MPFDRARRRPITTDLPSRAAQPAGATTTVSLGPLGSPSQATAPTFRTPGRMLAALCGVVVAAVGVVLVALGLVGATAVAAAADNGGEGDSSARAVSAVFECVAVNADGTFTALFGTSNSSDRTVALAAGDDNRVTPEVAANPPGRFPPGRAIGTFKVTWDGKNALVWHLPGGQATANRNGKACNTAPVVAEARNTAILAVVAAAIVLWWFNRRRAKLLAGS